MEQLSLETVSRSVNHKWVNKSSQLGFMKRKLLLFCEEMRGPVQETREVDVI